MSTTEMAHFWTSAKTFVDYGNGTLLDQFCRLQNVITNGSLDWASDKLSQTLSEEVVTRKDRTHAEKMPV